VSLFLLLCACFFTEAKMRLKPKPKIRPGGATRERSSVQQSVSEAEKACGSTITSVTTDSAVASKVCSSSSGSQEVCQTSNRESVESLKTCLISTEHDSSGSSDVTCQTCNATISHATTITDSTVSISTASVTSSSDYIFTSSSCKSSTTTSTSTSVTSSTRPTSLSSLSRTTHIIAENTDTPVSVSSNDVITELFNDEELPNVVQAENVLICDNDVDNDNSSDEEAATTEHHYPSFVESLSHIMSSHKVLGLEQPPDGEMQSSAVEGTLRQRCDESADDIDGMEDDDPKNDDGDNNVNRDVSVEGTAEKQVHICVHVYVVHVCLKKVDAVLLLKTRYHACSSTM